MNFYKRFIGDIQAKTGGLTLAEFGAYDRLLDHYYSTEQPITPKEVHRICRAMNASERSAVDSVLERFWDLTADGYVQSKADEVIEKARPLIEAARANGKKGGRPKKTKNPDETQQVSGNNPDGTQGEPKAKANQSQSQHSSSGEEETHKPRKRGAAAQLVSADDLVVEGVERQHADDWLTVRRKKGLALTPTAWEEVKAEAAKAGMSPAVAVKTAACNSWGGFKAKWLHEDSLSKPAAAGKHAGFAGKNYREGVSDDGSFH